MRVRSDGPAGATTAIRPPGRSARGRSSIAEPCQKAEGRRQKRSMVLIVFFLLPSAFCLLPSALKSVKRICKPNSVLPERSEDHSSATRVTAVVEQPTRKLITETGGSITSLFGLAPQGVFHAVAARAGRGALLPHRFTLASGALRRQFGGLFSVALSVALPRLDVIQPAARWSSDFPPRKRGDPPIRSTQESLTGAWR